jgi:acyl carrier protein
MNDKLVEIIAEVLEMEPQEIKDGLTPDCVEIWDSFTHVVLVTSIEEEFGIILHPQEATGITSVADIRVILRKRGIEV